MSLLYLFFIKKNFFKKIKNFYLRSISFSKYKKVLIKINNMICKFTKKTNVKLVSGSFLTKKIFKENEKRNKYFSIKAFPRF